MGFIGDWLREERRRLGLSQTEFGERGGVQKRAQINYEAGERLPDAAYLAAIAAAGADVRYIITGQRDGPAPEVLTSDERYLLERYRESPQALRDAALRVLLGGDPAAKSKKQTTISIGVNHGGQTAGKIINKKP